MPDYLQLSGTPSSVDIPPVLRQQAKDCRREVVQIFQASADLMKDIHLWTVETYRPIGPAKVVANLYEYADGSVLGIAKGPDGKIIGQARWVKGAAVTSRLAGSVAMLAGQAMLVQISQSLNRIEDKVDRILQALVDDRRAALNSAIKGVGDALKAGSPEISKGLLLNTAPQLRAAIEAEIQALRRIIDDVPEPDSHVRIMGRDIFNGASDTRGKLAASENGLLAVLEGVRAMVTLYTALNETKLGWSIAETLFTELSTLDLKSLRRKARCIPMTGDQPWPEVFWEHAIEAVERGRRQAYEFTTQGQPPLELEFSPEESREIISSAGGKADGIQVSE